MFWFSLQLLSEIFLILRRIQRDMIKYTDLHEKYRLVLSDFNEIQILTDFLKIFKYQISRKSIKQEPTDFPCRRTDRHHEANSNFSQFCKHALKKVKLYILMQPTQKLVTIQIYHLTGNALNWTQNWAQNLSQQTPLTLSSPKTCVCFNCNSPSLLLKKLLACDAQNY